MRISDWSSDVCSSDLKRGELIGWQRRFQCRQRNRVRGDAVAARFLGDRADEAVGAGLGGRVCGEPRLTDAAGVGDDRDDAAPAQSHHRSEEHTSELQSLMRISYAVFCLKKKKHI